jgi:hypothetical protein
MSDTETLNKLVNHAMVIDTKIARLSNELGELQDAKKELIQKHIPSAMEECGLTSFTSTDNFSVKAKEKVYASIPEETRARAYAWLRENNMGDIIKREFKLKLADDQTEQQQEVRNQLNALGLTADEKPAIHWATLNKNMGECLEAGLEIPESIKVSQVTEVKINHVQS